MKVIAGARASSLSRAQCEEVRSALPGVAFEFRWVFTRGDRDQTTSLRTLGKSDFFTSELDAMLQKGEIQVAIHSAKDLPEPLPPGLALVALTKGVDSRDSLVLRPDEALNRLPPHARIATSSSRREESVKALRSDLQFIDLRGTIEQRLAKLETREADGVVVAEAALIRLKLTHLNRLFLPGETTPLQGRLAIVARIEDRAMRTLFAPLDVCLEKPSI